MIPPKRQMIKRKLIVLILTLAMCSEFLTQIMQKNLKQPILNQKSQAILNALRKKANPYADRLMSTSKKDLTHLATLF